MANAQLTEELFSQLQGAPLQRISQSLGVAPDRANDAVAAALPLLLGALGRNASQPQGAQALYGALGRDHGGMDLGSLLGAVLGGGMGAGPGSAAGGGTGGLGGLLGQVLGGGDAGDAGGRPGATLPQLDGRRANADGILGHVFGDRQDRAEDGLGQVTGLGRGGAHELLRMLAPIVMGFLAQRFLSGRNDGDGVGGLQQALGQEREQIHRQGGLGGGLFNAVLDQDGDGQVDLSDLMKLGGSFLGGRR